MIQKLCFIFLVCLTDLAHAADASGSSTPVPTQNELLSSLIPADVLARVQSYDALVSDLGSDASVFWNFVLEFYFKIAFTAHHMNDGTSEMKSALCTDEYKESIVLVENLLATFIPGLRQPGIQYTPNTIADALTLLSSIRGKDNTSVRFISGSPRPSTPDATLLENAAKVYEDMKATPKTDKSAKKIKNVSDTSKMTPQQKSQYMLNLMVLSTNAMKVIDKVTPEEYFTFDADQQDEFKRMVVFAYMTYGDGSIPFTGNKEDLRFDPDAAFFGNSSTPLERMFIYMRSFQTDGLHDGTPKYNLKEALSKSQKTILVSTPVDPMASKPTGDKKDDASASKPESESKSWSKLKWVFIIGGGLLVLAAVGGLIYYLIKSKD
ncbi:hypothetical protein THOM_2757 [Trachipleistophora hominis]|uniref:Uncharacterized protein n=1 Tax=Trachipleistophora hominis TaxID=72359 RepID=L7JSB1_TRAHO|nr:hypothetical protein THOM_2757 [Trachipleistophora hominis]